MSLISIRDFSCIKQADIKIKKVNVIIGPQGSGKSVATKLIYFFNDIIPSIISRAEDGMTINEFKAHIKRSFTVWFPPQAWGDKRFQINFNDGKFGVRILRRKMGGKLSGEVSVKFSPWLDELYSVSQSAFNEINEKIYEDDDEGVVTSHHIEMSSRIRGAIWSHIRRSADFNVVNNQVFIPAGRAFFTSIGKMVAGLEQGVSLDPATLRFARLFASWRDLPSYTPRALMEADFQDRRRKVMIEFFGGVVQVKRESEFIEMEDGRKVPFSSLSSGQQELLPIWFFLDNIMSIDERNRHRSAIINRRTSDLIYIEEPEAHLFPKAQCDLLDVLISRVTGGNPRRRMIITTHSPYLMSRLNVLLTAGRLSRRRKINTKIGLIVPRESWLNIEDFSALKIDDGVVSSIINDDEGLVDAVFLDEVSDVISQDFENLLELEGGI
ncbi:AAA family ATPase [Nitratireductor sp. B36]|uniref:AAA family ATPase n=1 Tax=Nitratireductor sp. B36 TaxID=2762059 RepID=UPI001E5E1A48|nr:ATP-binding protein [Nitratireductor sp. B36]MCC5780861.1 AAA family ATPase [Nitratireductor sp. B36]